MRNALRSMQGKQNKWMLISIIIMLSFSFGWMTYGAMREKDNDAVNAARENAEQVSEQTHFEEVLNKSADKIMQFAERRREETERILKKEAERIGETVEKAAQAAGEHITPEFIRESLSAGMTKEKVKAVLGDHYRRLESEDGTMNLWRYDYLRNTAYDVPMNGNNPDVEGIANGSIHAQLFIEWNEDETLRSYSFYQLNEEGKLEEYHLTSDEETKEPSP